MRRLFRIIRTIVIAGILVFGFLFVKEKFNFSVDAFGENYDSDYIYVLNRQDKSKVSVDVNIVDALILN